MPFLSVDHPGLRAACDAAVPALPSAVCSLKLAMCTAKNLPVLAMFYPLERWVRDDTIDDDVALMLLRQSKKRTADFAIVVREAVLGLPTEYLLFLIGHEVGHANIFKQEGEPTHVAGATISGLWPSIVAREINLHEFPQELYCDRFGYALAIRVFGKAAVLDAFKTVANLQPKQRDSLTRVAGLPDEFPELPVAPALRAFCAPYQAEMLKRSSETGRRLLEDFFREPTAS